MMRKAVNERLPNQGHFFNADHSTARFTPAGPDHAQIAAGNGVTDYMEAVHDHHFDGEASTQTKASRVLELFHQQEHGLLQPLLDFLDKRPGVRLIGSNNAEHRAPTVSFTAEGREPADIAARLAEQKIGIGNGNCYAYRLMQALDIPPGRGVARLSFVHYTSKEEVTRLTEALDKLL